jgi:C_GCAxxG_C_C family probable redox protein
MRQEMNSKKTIPGDTKKVFLKYLTCSRTFSYLLNRELGHTNENEERASDSLAGGLANLGHQCGMLWGAALAVGAESYGRNDDRGLAIAMAIAATQRLMESFSNTAKSVKCQDIIGFDLNNKVEAEKFMKTSFYDIENSPCFNLAEKWAPDAIYSAREALSHKQTEVPELPMSCASELAQKMGATDEEVVTVAGFAGGLGLSGNACGALSAAIWMKNLA